MKDLIGRLTLLLVFLLVTIPAVAVSHEPIESPQFIYCEDVFEETKTIGESGIFSRDYKGGVVDQLAALLLSAGEVDERSALVACIIRPYSLAPSNNTMETSFIMYSRWKEHPAFLGIA